MKEKVGNTANLIIYAGILYVGIDIILNHLAPRSDPTSFAYQIYDFFRSCLIPCLSGIGVLSVILLYKDVPFVRYCLRSVCVCVIVCWVVLMGVGKTAPFKPNHRVPDIHQSPPSDYSGKEIPSQLPEDTVGFDGKEIPSQLPEDTVGFDGKEIPSQPPHDPPIL